MSMLRYLFSIVLEYIRWSQMAPMILAWAFLLIALVAMTVINLQQASFTFLEWLMGIWQRYDWLPTWDNGEISEQDGTWHITDEQLKPLILKAWGVLSLLLLIIDLLRTSLFGPREPKPLSRSLLIAAIVCVLFIAGFLLNYFFGSEPYAGSKAGWLALFIGGPAVVWLISAYGLSVNHLLSRINNKLINNYADSRRIASY